MKRLSLFFAVLLCATPGLRAQTDLVARIHFLGGDKISADPASAAFTNEFCSAEAKTLESQTLDKLSRAPGERFKSKLAPGAGDGVAQLRPLLDDLLKSEWIFEVRDATNGSPEYALAIRMSDQRAKLWQDNLRNLAESWTGSTAKPTSKGWFAQTEQASNLVFCVYDKRWLELHWQKYQRPINPGFFDEANNKIMNAELHLVFLDDQTSKNTNWLTADLNWPRLAQLFPALKEFDFPKMAMQVVGRDGSLQWNGRFTLSSPLPPLDNWRVPTNLIHQPLISLTAVRGIGTWLARQDWTQPYEISPPPDQFFIWAMAQVPYQTFAAAPVPDAPAAMAQLWPKISASLDARAATPSLFKLAAQMTNNNIAFTGVPFFSPFVLTMRDPAGGYVFGGFFPNTPRLKTVAPESFLQLARPGLVYYHWEITSNRLTLLPQLSQLILMVSGHRQLGEQSAAYKWLGHLGPILGESVTEVTQTAPAELTFTRRAAAGLTAVELTALASWLEATNFPGCDLRLPAMRLRQGQGPVRPLNPPAAPRPN